MKLKRLISQSEIIKNIMIFSINMLIAFQQFGRFSLQQLISRKLGKKEKVFHPRSLIFRRMKIDKLKTLGVDISLNGLKHKITKTIDIKDGKEKIIEGKNRYISCMIVNVDFYRNTDSTSSLEGLKDKLREAYALSYKIKEYHVRKGGDKPLNPNG